MSALETANKKLKLAYQRNRRLKNKVDSVQQLLHDLKTKDLLTDQAVSNLSGAFSESVLAIVARCLNKKTHSLPRNVYPKELRNFALSLHFYSAKAYEFVRSQFHNCLPHPKTLVRWYSCIEGNPGFHNETFTALQQFVDSRGGQPILCSMMMDEIAIRKQVLWDGKKYVGYIDHGVPVEDSSSLPVAKEALVMMIVCMTERWKIPVAYFLIDGLRGQERANLVLICLRKLYAVGIRVVSLTFDGSSANCNMVTHLGCSLNVSNLQCSFHHPENANQQIFIFLDACHMLKLLRNMLADKGILIDNEGRPIKWSYIVDLQTLQAQEGVHAGNKLHQRHIEWQQQKMKVKLAAQTLSSSVADALCFCKDVLKLPQFEGCQATVDFIRLIDRLFDFLNSRNPVARGYKAPLRDVNEPVWRPFVVDARQYLSGLKLANGQLVTSSLRKTGVVGFIVSSCSAVTLYDVLVVRESLLKYVLTYKMSQDHLELFFSAVRSRGGWNNNPSVVQFKAAWKRLLSHQQLKEVTSGNCAAQLNCPLLLVSSCLAKHEITDVATATTLRLNDTMRELCLVDCVQYDDSTVQMSLQSLSLFVENVVVYIAGFVVRNLLKRLHCSVCKAALFNSLNTDTSQCADFGLLNVKNRGGLVSPSGDVVRLCKVSESHFRSHMGPSEKPVATTNLQDLLTCGVLQSFIGADIFTGLTDHTFDTDPVDDHRVLLMKRVVDEYMRCRLYYQGKSYSRNIQGENKRSKLTKSILFCGQ